MLRDGASSSRTTSRTVTVDGGVTSGSPNAGSADVKPSGNSEDGDSSFGEAAAFAFCRLRCL
jgi:hypothetical protein